MSALTSLLLGCLAVFFGGWFLDKWTGNFSLLLFVLTVVTMVYWLAEKLVFAPQRRRRAEAVANEWEAEQRARGGELNLAARAHVVQPHLEQPWWLDWTAGLFPIILVVFLLRSFLFEPFKIPTGSMIPTLLVGDLILVNKYHYGVRLPVLNKKIIHVNDPQRGDVMVFRYPLDPSVDYIKRVVGLPGDEVAYRDKQLFINGERVQTEALKEEFYEEGDLKYLKQFDEQLGPVKHKILIDPQRNMIPQNGSFPYKDNCRYSADSMTCKVPEGHYFMMGDNRDNSQDSRYWGFVPDQNIVGKAFFVWMNFGDPKRVGAFH
jgi:signal peptidase I